MLEWELLKTKLREKITRDVGHPIDLHYTWRARVPGGWLVAITSGKRESSPSATFVPDPQHEWDGTSRV